MELSTVSSLTSNPNDQSPNNTIIAFYVYIALSTLGVIGNAYVCLVMLRYRKIFNSTTNKLIIHQSFVDFLGSLVFLFRRILVVSPPAFVPDNILGSLYCKLWWSEWPQYGMFLTSTYNLVAISMERYFATCHSVSHRNMFSTRRLKMIMATTWMCGWIPEAHLIAISYQINNACDVSWKIPAVQAIGGVVIFLLELIIPLVVIVFAYTKIILELHRRSTARVRDMNNEARKMLSKANKNVTKTLLVVAIFFAICWIPTDINYILYNIGLNNNSTDSFVYQAVGAIVVVNTCINPVIYCFTYDRFRKQAKRMVCGRFQHGINRVDLAEESATHNTSMQTTEGNAAVSVIRVTDNHS